MRRTLAVMLLGALCTVTAIAQTPAAPAAASNKVMSWKAGDVEAMGKDQMKVITTENAKIAVTLVDMWKEATAVRIQVTNLGSDPLAAPPDAFTLVAKGDTIAAVPADVLMKKIKSRAENEAETVGSNSMRYAAPNSAGEQDERNRIRSEGTRKAEYIRDSALPAALQPRFQVIGHVYFPYLKKRDEVLVRVTMGGTTYEFPFQKSDIHPAY